MIEAHADGGLLTLTLNRPEKANALTGEMLGALCEAIETTAARALILTGRGTVFSAGADLDEAPKGLAVSPLWERLSGAIAGFPGLTVAALNGTVAGGAMGMVLACDIRLAVPGAKAFYPVMRLGYRPQPSDPARLASLIGPARAKMILICGQKVAHEEALQWGLFDRIVDDPETEARQLAADSLAATSDHAAALKAMIPG